ncbi:glycosyltransferase family 92 protein [Alloacidobacterium sp.]|uniref:glycosyltransferase family 92 protein n=1 Tax=Alloacidobacterium sp. TaxID=2951999 RepID=UPI002D28608D|nr:glycosyltransferase family 92 protein [Alloacidobacterium sp.]HYK36355.1 glycosyltransferase family 92 protein [Alloacidobacterium sp.]
MKQFFVFREKLRSNQVVAVALYTFSNLWVMLFSHTGRKIRAATTGVALCLRFRNEARYLEEWLEYHRAAGTDHFFLYNNFSNDNYLDVLKPWISRNLVTLIDWPKVPASPDAEEDCIRRAAGRFSWVGFIDADEFIVIGDGRSIGEFLASFEGKPAVALHWRMFGSSWHKERPAESVTIAYHLRAEKTNRHVKCFVRPEEVTACRNSHCFFYRKLGRAVTEHKHPVYGSVRVPASSGLAWINHYYCKSQEDYLLKTKQSSTLDRVGMRYPSRQMGKIAEDMARNNEVSDTCAVEYFRKRTEKQMRSA